MFALFLLHNSITVGAIRHACSSLPIRRPPSLVHGPRFQGCPIAHWLCPCIYRPRTHPTHQCPPAGCPVLTQPCPSLSRERCRRSMVPSQSLVLGVDVFVFTSLGLLACRSIGFLIHRSIGFSVCWILGLLGHVLPKNGPE